MRSAAWVSAAWPIAATASPVSAISAVTVWIPRAETAARDFLQALAPDAADVLPDFDGQGRVERGGDDGIAKCVQQVDRGAVQASQRRGPRKRGLRERREVRRHENAANVLHDSLRAP